MPLKNDRYTYRVTWSEDDNEYVGLCAEFPSLSWLAKTPEAALKGIRSDFISTESAGQFHRPAFAQCGRLRQFPCNFRQPGGFLIGW